MEASHISAVLEAAGIRANDETKSSLVVQMESWLGIHQHHHHHHQVDKQQQQEQEQEQEMLTAEDCSPMPESVYVEFQRLCIQAWQSKVVSQHENLLLEAARNANNNSDNNNNNNKNRENHVIALCDVWDSVRATSWLHAWMELAVDVERTTDRTSSSSSCAAAAANAADTSTISSTQLLSVDDHHWVLLVTRYHSDALIQSLYHHIQNLPTYQAHMHAYTHWLQQQPISDNYNINSNNSNSNNKKHTLNSTQPRLTPQQRIEAVLKAQEIASRLTHEWNTHVQQLHDICALWYRAASALQRAFMRTLMAKLWMRYLLRTTTTTSTSLSGVTRLENTQAAGLSLTLQTLFCILQGSSTQQQQQQQQYSVHRNLLFHSLIPLHQPNALVLWRDQAPLLSLYHEPLVQCTATILKLHPDLVPDACLALIQTDIFPPAGNTNKQVLLLHELDTYLGLFGSFAVVRSPNSNHGANKKNTTTTTNTTPTQNTKPPFWLQEQQQQQDTESSWFVHVCHVLARCMSSEHSGLAERALQMIKNVVLMQLVRIHAEHCAPIFLRALVPTSLSRNNNNNALSTLSWNPTVRKMTYLALQTLQNNLPPSVFAHAANQLRILQSTTNASSESSASLSNRSLVAANNNPVATTRSAKPSQQRHSVMGQPSSSPQPRKMLLPPGNKQRNNTVSMPPPASKPPTKTGILGTTWKPPPGRRSGGGGNNISNSRVPRASAAPPPVTITGVAPWAMSTAPAPAPPKQQQPPVTITGVAPWAMSAETSKQQQPPLTITGVAPWALANAATNKSPRSSSSSLLLQQKRSVPTEEAESDADHITSLTGISEFGNADMMESHEEEEEDDDDGDAKETLPDAFEESGKNDAKTGAVTNDTPAQQQQQTNSKTASEALVIGCGGEEERTGLKMVLDYMEKLKPPEEEGDGSGLSSWSKTQMAETPTLLPALKFHDLVFGHDLGTGSFGTVKYARLIERNKTRSKWPEFAVKVVSTDKIRQMGYEASIQREIAVLRMLSHPGIARLVSSFRFREGAYLVLEYASQGDLHALLRKQGSLDHEATRFVVGELVAALASIHELGLVYGDLKPENIVITEVGHIKLTDFGGCRPVTKDAKERVQTIAKNILRDLRDGDWQENKPDKSEDTVMKEDGDSNEQQDKIEADSATGDEMQQYEDDVRVEGTTAYLPPEVVMGAHPTPAADSWALGCVMYQCLTGRPPLLDVDDEATRQRIVTFVSGNSALNTEGNDNLFTDKHSIGISDPARQLIRATLNRNRNERPDMYEISRHVFFTSEEGEKKSTNVFALHTQIASPLEVGNVAPAAADAQWARRQYSSIWAPQPPQYSLSLDGADGDNDRHQSKSKHKTVLAALAASTIPEGEEAHAYFSTKANFTPMDTAVNNNHTASSSSVADNVEEDVEIVSSLSIISEANPSSSG